MSEFTNHTDKNSHQLYELTKGFVKGDDGKKLVAQHQVLIDTVQPIVIIKGFHLLMKDGYPMADVKKAINKVMNLLGKALNKYDEPKPESDSFLDVLIKNNKVMEVEINKLRPLLKQLNIKADDDAIKSQIVQVLDSLLRFMQYYTVKENILFPAIENKLPEYRCLQIMWSFHDDIIGNIKSLKVQLELIRTDLKEVNRLMGLVFFNMFAVKFREEKVLFPVIEPLFKEVELNQLLKESIEMGLPYYSPNLTITDEEEALTEQGHLNLGTGGLSLEQIKLLFNHLPVDITYVDEHDRVQFFSTPPKRIFPRSKAIIGRLVQNCHPHESIEVVNKIVASFKSGEKSQADFWIKMKGQMLMIQYFALRDEQGAYRGVIEVSQEVSHIMALEGEKRLLDW